MKLGNSCSFNEIRASVLDQNTELLSDLLDKLQTDALFRMVDSNGDMILHIACNAGNVKAVLAALESGADLNARNESAGDTPLHIAMRRGNVVIIMHLLNNGASVTEKNFSGNTPIHEAVISKVEKKILKRVVESFVSTEASSEHSSLLNKAGKTPMDIATEMNDSEIISTLMPLETALTRKKRFSNSDKSQIRPNDFHCGN
ncbi:ankyrin repeat domain-containing protein [Neorickettsia sennetsu]|uniref:Ankyrin repeat protein n=1 Tax=Ehrlichia sennetsu (strain ATCC VR-367 / Miyayama) TaxID=222891 RepID=Q2GF38_EHRS3|nr:ankyrin repeat domain-containing protein [Neorickettsia sennetsu]ABD45931.1 ankyrin repeat protein [Neorickettsia sennetsu str. Miyayama]